jgi:3-phenylpropionate/trans-cinnamate dioxygenase ferredoxin reductase subunit
MLGQDVTFDRVPYFFTDQYDLGMEYSGLAGPDATVVYRGDPEGGEYIAFWLEDGRITAGMNVNVWDVTDPIQALIRTRQQVPVATLTDVDTPLERLTG